MSRTIGQHIASRLQEQGCETFFTVPGDFNLVLLDQLLLDQKLHMVCCCNELNAGYAADGYARAKGIACVVTTFTVGGLSVLNAIAGANSEDLPVICITGGPNSNDFGTNRILHHTIGDRTSFRQEYEAFKPFTCYQTEIFNLDDAHEQVDTAIATALRLRKPCYINICCNLAGLGHPTFDPDPVPYAINYKTSNPASLEAAVEEAARFLNAAVKPVLVAGVHLHMAKAEKQLVDLADAAGYPVAIMPNAKGMFPETHKQFIGTYWGQVSTAYCSETVESSDAYLFAGPIFNDYTSCGYSLLIKKEKMVKVDPYQVTVGGRRIFNCVCMADFLAALAPRLQANAAAHDNYKRMFIPPGQPLQAAKDAPLLTNTLFKHVQALLSGKTSLLAETGDSWFNCQKLRLPEGCGYHFQCQYGSIGWSVGASLGLAQALRGRQRLVSCIGDGSFQVTCQDVSTMLRYELNPVIFLINNGGYTIEVEIHDGPYNVIRNWDYCGFVRALANGGGKVQVAKATTEAELEVALKLVEEHPDSCGPLPSLCNERLVFIEAVTHKDDCSRELLEWGSRVSEANSRPPNPQ